MKRKNMTKAARVLRRNMTTAEKLVWSKLRGDQLGVRFRRQHPMEKYIVDLVCPRKKLIIEIDGGQHFENKQDKLRDRWFAEKGFKVLRFWNTDVMKNIEGVVEMIRKEIDTLPFLPSLKGGDAGGGSFLKGGESKG